MPTECSDILKVAQELAAGADEARHRSAISRAYYAALHRTIAALPEEFAIPREQVRSGSSHEAIIQSLTQWGRSTTPGRQAARMAARHMPRLKAERKKADYFLEDTVSQAKAQDAVEMAIEVLSQLDDACSKAAPSAV